MAKTHRVGKRISVDKNSGVVNLQDMAEDIKHEPVTSAPEPAAAASVSPQEPLISAEPLSIDKSPLLADEISIMAHAGSAGQPQTEGNSDFKLNGDLFGTPTQSPKPESTEPEAPKFEFPEDVPSMESTATPPTINPDGTTSAPAGSIPNEIKGAIDNSMADMICDLYKDGVPALTFTWTKLKEDKIKSLKNQGLIEQPIVDQTIDLNKSIKKQLKERAAEDAKLLNGPLTRVLNEKQVKTTPMGELMITICFIALMNFILIKELKGETNALMNAIMQKIDEKQAMEQEAA